MNLPDYLFKPLLEEKTHRDPDDYLPDPTGEEVEYCEVTLPCENSTLPHKCMFSKKDHHLTSHLCSCGFWWA